MAKNKKPDNSARISQRDKLRDSIILKEFPWTENQKQFIKLALDKNTKIIICKGSAGVGKTLLSLYCSLILMNNKYVSDIIFYRSPIESASRSLGFLAGDYSTKISFYGFPLEDQLKELVSPNVCKSLVQDKRITVESIGFAKGRTHNVQSVICDEAEDLTVQELELIMGRMGRFSKLFIIGDEHQTNVKNSGLNVVYDLFNIQEAKEKGIHTLEFTAKDCMRNDILKFIIEQFDKHYNKK